MGISTVHTSTHEIGRKIGLRSFLSFFQKCKYRSYKYIILFLQSNTNTKMTSTVKINPWDGICCQIRQRSFLLWLKIFCRDIYIFENKVFFQVLWLSAQHKICCQIVQIFFLSWACQRYRADCNYLSSFFPFVFLFLLQISLFGGDLKDWCWHLWVLVSGRQFKSLTFSSNLSLKCKLDSDLVLLMIVNTNSVSN